MNRIKIVHLNINSLRNKFESLQEQINKNVDILLISEIKLDNSFLTGQFLIKGYSAPYRLDGDAQGGGIMLFIREDIPSKLLAVEDFPTEWFYIEINLRKKKWLLCCSYNPKKSNIRAHLECLNKRLALHLLKYEHFIVLGDFNVCVEDSSMSEFCDMYNLKSLIREPTCYKNSENPSCIDLILTNRPCSFQNSYVFETGLSDFHMMTVTVMKMHFQKLQPRVINYRDCKHFQNETFREDLLFRLSKLNIRNNDYGFTGFIETCMETVNQYAPCKQKQVQGNHLPFMNKTLSKEIMTRTRLRNRFLKNRTEENKKKYTKQRNYCVSLLRKVKNKYYSNLNEKDVTGNKMFWKIVKAFFSDKVTSSEKITFIEEDEII